MTQRPSVNMLKGFDIGGPMDGTLSPHMSKVPFDAHFARALIAPKSLINTHARHDYWANPYGTHLTFLASNPAFALYQKSDHNAMHWRDGGHGQLQ